jgi:hypothetical protein
VTRLSKLGWTEPKMENQFQEVAPRAFNQGCRLGMGAER